MGPKHSLCVALGCAAFASICLAACSSGDSPTNPGSNAALYDTLTVSGGLVDSVGAAFDAQVAAGDDLVTPISRLLGGLFPVEDQESALDSVIAAGTPFVTEQQFSDLAAAFRENVSFDVDNFVGAAAASGATTRATGASLDRATLTDILTPLVSAPRYRVSEILPATVIAIGRARAKREGIKSADPVWGDGLLDPLQTTLLMYAIDYADVATVAGAPSRSLARSARGALFEEEVPEDPWHLAADKAKDAIADKVTDFVAEKIHFPLDKKEAAKASVCSSIILYSYKFDLQQTQGDLWHRDPAAPQHQSTSNLPAHLRFDFNPYNAFSSLVLSKIGCELPPVGDAPQKSVSWSIDD